MFLEAVGVWDFVPPFGKGVCVCISPSPAPGLGRDQQRDFVTQLSLIPSECRCLITFCPQLSASFLIYLWHRLSTKGLEELLGSRQFPGGAQSFAFQTSL